MTAARQRLNLEVFLRDPVGHPCCRPESANPWGRRDGSGNPKCQGGEIHPSKIVTVCPAALSLESIPRSAKTFLPSGA